MITFISYYVEEASLHYSARQSDYISDNRDKILSLKRQ